MDGLEVSTSTYIQTLLAAFSIPLKSPSSSRILNGLRSFQSSIWEFIVEAQQRNENKK